MHVSVLFQVYTGFSSNLRTYCGHGVCKQQVILSFCNWRTRLPLVMSLWPLLLLWCVEPRRGQNPINSAPDWSVVVSGPRAIYPPRDGLSDSWNVCVDHTRDQGPPLNILIFFHGSWPETNVTTDSINWSHACSSLRPAVWLGGHGRLLFLCCSNLHLCALELLRRPCWWSM